jgi:phosphatidylglycerophosphatase C
VNSRVGDQTDPRSRSVDGQTIVARLEELTAGAAGGARVLAFDGDGTLWTGDVGFDLFEALLDRGDVREAARQALEAEARSIGLASGASALDLARSLYRRYQDGGWAHDRAFAAMAWAFAGWTLEEVAVFSREVTRKTGLLARLRSSLAGVVAWAKDHGVEVFIVSASPRAIVECGADLLSIPISNVIAMTPEVDGAGVLLPRLTGHVIYGDGKYQALRAVRPDAVILGAFGDSFYDAPMLRAASLPVAVAPSQGLVEILDSIPGVVVLSE